ncbi:hypothetical protein G3I40_22440, partial [Streptomyces sp. SID14478]|uniref:hypothetical protein n=1 Tax=Streptomyces sp. SID14478 TaxID=2706073 RepID=UPI0013DB6141
MPDGMSRRSALRRIGGAVAVAAAATTGLPVPASAATSSRARHGAGPRVESLLARLSLDEKLT